MKKYLFTSLSVLISLNSYSQTISNDDIKQGEQMIEAYFMPLTQSFGTGLNNGWYNTAKPHSLGGFDFTVTLNSVIIANSVQSFNIQEAGEKTFTSANDEASTILGIADGTQMTYNPNGIDTSYNFTMPGGFNTIIVPLPIMQAGIGLIKNTGIDFRFIPKMNVGKSGDESIEVSLFGVGLKHDLLQWIPAVGDAIPMSLSLQGGYTSLNAEMEIDKQKINLNTRSATMNLIASRKLLMVTGYAGLGYNLSTTSFSTDAKFDLGGLKFDEKIDATFESNNNLRANVGLRLNMTLVTIHADYTFAKYHAASLGLGVSLR